MLHVSVASLWEAHCREGWPQFSSPHEGELMTLDTVIGGCAVFYLDGETRLDGQRIGILEDCIADLDNLLDDMADEHKAYFQRLRQLAMALLDCSRPA
ncbi:hypothetical protein FBQ96_07440 [Nitrospirales bacterium NOB]|nr:MAG: hypothetical protein UZ03_NOB001002069 [Nitrospira sp. OLB3]MBV6470028.1 hypothetical protein [Nitrospirota bacterium]MCK6494319.1 hypothetical protein [Nitrospira sp.]MDL1889398.1 hypothetical protein [Nitrospirales bacterium NOB]MEB2338339.1 hypothetical protein [Nitrospirales bacterium]